MRRAGDGRRDRGWRPRQPAGDAGGQPSAIYGAFEVQGPRFIELAATAEQFVAVVDEGTSDPACAAEHGNDFSGEIGAALSAVRSLRAAVTASVEGGGRTGGWPQTGRASGAAPHS